MPKVLIALAALVGLLALVAACKPAAPSSPLAAAAPTPTLRAEAQAPDDEGSGPAHVALARSFMAALNAHDVETLVGLFSEDGPGATVNADRYAWTAFEIRLWAQQQVHANIWVDAGNYDATQHGAAWTATVHRADFQELGVEGLPVLNTTVVADGKIMNFTSRLADSRDAERLERLWSPGSIPDYPTR